MLLLLLWLAAWAASQSVSFERRVDAVLAVEHARAAFTVAAPVPLDKAFGHDDAAKRVPRRGAKGSSSASRRT